MNHHVLNWVRSVSLLSVLLLLVACSTAPIVLTEIEIREVFVPVTTPFPSECFASHRVPGLQNEALTIEQLVAWTDAMVDTLIQYQVQMLRCRGLNSDLADDQVAPLAIP